MFGDDWLVPFTAALAGLLLGGMCLAWRPNLPAVEGSGAGGAKRAMPRWLIRRLVTPR